MSASATLTRRAFLCLCATALASMVMPAGLAWAYERDEHDDITEEILFGKDIPETSKKDALKALENAVYLCIDQAGKADANNSGKASWDELNKYFTNAGANGIPAFEDIVLAGINKGKHDKYTHMGWHHDYSEINTPERWNERWSKRQKLLIDTVNLVFDFGLWDEAKIGIGFSADTQCDAFAELLYYIHVLGDFRDTIQTNIEDGEYEMDLDAIAFAEKDPSDTKRDFFWDLDESLRIISNGTDAQSDYEKLSEELAPIASSARRHTTVSSKASAEKFRKNVIKTQDALKKRVPSLLMKVDFFKNAIDKLK